MATKTRYSRQVSSRDDLYASKTKAQRDAKRYSRDPDWSREVKAIKVPAYRLVWGAKKRKSTKSR